MDAKEQSLNTKENDPVSDVQGSHSDEQGHDPAVREQATDTQEHDFPTSDQLQRELEHEQYRRKYARTLRGTLVTLITVSAIAVLVATLVLPVLQIYGTSMTPTLQSGDTVVSIKTSNFKTGDIIAFYLTSNRVLVKRVIATSGQWVDIDEDGRVYVDGELLDEPYVDDLDYGQCDITLPYQVPDEQIFVMGDHRSVSVDSRSSTVGCVSQDQIVGKIVLRVWPLKSFGLVK